MQTPSLTKGRSRRGCGQKCVAAKRTIELDPVRCGFQSAEHQRALCCVIRTLRVEGAEEALNAVAVAGLGQPERVRGGLLLAQAGANLLADGAAPGERIGDVAERLLD